MLRTFGGKKSLGGNVLLKTPPTTIQFLQSRQCEGRSIKRNIEKKRIIQNKTYRYESNNS